MSLLQAVEEHLGCIDICPVYIINYLFVETPWSSVIEELTTLFAGNGVT